MGILEYNLGAGTSFYDLAVSMDGTGLNWNIYQVNVSQANVPGGPFLADFPKIGFNADEVVVTFNQARFQTLTLDHYLILSLNAPQLFAGTLNGTLVNLPFGSQNVTLFPASMHGSAPGDPMYFVETGDGSNMRVVTGANLLTAPTLTTTTLNVAAYQQAPAVPVTNHIDARVVSTDWRNGKLVAAHTIGLAGNSDAHARWYEFNAPVNGTPTLAQQGTITVPGGDAFYPSIAINTVGGMGMTYLEMGGTASPFMSMAVTARLATDAPGTMRKGNVPFDGKGTSAYNGTRAGDYSATVTDPSDGRTFWAANEFATNGTWGTAIARFSAETRVNSADFNADGVSDILWRQLTGGTFNQIWYMRPPTSPLDNGVLQYGPGLPTVVFTPVIGDFNGDGVSDILWYNPNGGTNNGIWYMRPPTGPLDIGVLATGPAFNVVGFVPVIGDFNGDGVSDILWYKPGTGANNGIWYMRPPTGPQDLGVLQYGPAFNNGSYVPVIGDFNGDGVSDILWWNSNGSTNNGIWYMRPPINNDLGVLFTGPGFDYIGSAPGSAHLNLINGNLLQALLAAVRPGELPIDQRLTPEEPP